MSVKVTIIENGPAIIDSEDYLLIESGTPPPKGLASFTKKIAICRCGKSGNGVWCDGSHSKKEAPVINLGTIEQNSA
jgi:CDGSH-type Zn-finger protein